MIEPPFVRIEARMVLAGPPSPIPSQLEDFTNKRGIAEVPIASVVIQSGQQTNTGRPALGSIVGLGVANSILRQTI